MPVGTYSQTLRMFEGLDVPTPRSIGPSYSGVQAGYATIRPDLLIVQDGAERAPASRRPGALQRAGHPLKVTVRKTA